jgi:DNA invertase Pin-like site-specific DNA recombinase
MRRHVDTAQPAINLEYRRRSIKLDNKKVRKLTATLQAEGLSEVEIAARVAEAAERGELLNNESVSFARQHDENVNLARSEGADLSTAIAFEEEGSAYKRKRRPEFDAMMKWIESFEGSNPINLYVYELSRLFRNKDVADEAIALLTRKKVNLRIASQPQIRLDDEMSSMFLPLLVQFAINESKQTSKRTTGGQLTRANLGTVRTSTPPVGLTTTKSMTSME